MPLAIRETGTDEEVLELVPKEESIRFPSVHRLAAKLNWTDRGDRGTAGEAEKAEEGPFLKRWKLLPQGFLERVTGKTTEMLTAFHQANPIAAGMEKEEFKSRILESFYLKEAKKAMCS